MTKQTKQPERGMKEYKRKLEEWEKVKLPKTWRYNVKELRMERHVPSYDENEEYCGHVWAALVPHDIQEFVSQTRQQTLEEVFCSCRGRSFEQTKTGYFGKCRTCKKVIDDQLLNQLKNK
jgi:hypothetical protein